MTKLLAAFLFLFPFFVFGQTITITDGDKVKSFPDNSYFEMSLGDFETTNKESCCPTTYITGTITGTEDDVITFELRSLKKNYVRDDGKHILDKDELFPINNQLKFNKSDIAMLSHADSYKAYKKKDNWQGVGSVLFLSGIMTSAVALFVKDKKNRNNLLIAGGIQFGAGFILGISGVEKRYKLKGKKAEWKFQ